MSIGGVQSNHTPHGRGDCSEDWHARLDVPAIESDTAREFLTQIAFGRILDDLAKGKSCLASRILTTSPDVTGTTSLGP